MKYDCEIGGLPFLFATNQQTQYRRETAEFRRQRVDQERDPGEQSLDSGYWVRSQQSFHLGAGLDTQEPITVTAAEARFRFMTSKGVDVSTPGQVRLLPATTLQQANSSSVQYRGVISVNTDHALYWHHESFYKVDRYGTPVITTLTNPFTAGTSKPIRSATTDGATAVICGKTEIATGDSTWPTTFAIKYADAGGNFSRVRFAKDRLILCNGNKLHEITNLAPGTPPAAIPAAFYTHKASNWGWDDIAEGPEAIYAAGDNNQRSEIFAIGLTESSGAYTLGAPRSVAILPIGESVRTMLSVLGSYLVLVTKFGVRVCQFEAGGGLKVGPLLLSGQAQNGDAVLKGTQVIVAFANETNFLTGATTELWAIDLANPMEGELRFPVTPHSCHGTSATRAFGVALLQQDEVVWVNKDGLVSESFDYLRQNSGYLITGRIRMGTLEAKAWKDATVTFEPSEYYGPSGFEVNGGMKVYLYTSSSASGPWTLAAEAGDATDATTTVSKGAITAPTQGSDLYVKIELVSNTTAYYDDQVHSRTPVVTGYQVSSLPTPKRSRLLSVPIQLWDFEKDRNGGVVGSRGYAWQRLAALEAMEQSSGLVTYVDKTTGETASAYIERVSFTRLTPPFRGEANAGGVGTVLLRLVV